MITTGGALLRVALGEGAAALDRNLEDVEVAGRDREPAAAAVRRALERPADDDERQAVAALRAARSTWRWRATTPGSARSRSTPSRTICSTPADFRKRGPVSDIRIVSTLVGVEARDRRGRSATAVRISSAEPTSRMSASATSTTTSTERVLFWRKPVPERPPLSFSVALRSAREPCSAGIRPKRMPVPSDTASVKREHAPVDADQRAVLADARQAGGVDRQQRADADDAEQRARATPPAIDSTTLSVSSWRMMPAAAGADRGADGDLALAAGGAHEQQVGDVGAGDQQHEADRADQHEQRRPRRC